ncbi:MAG: Uma2 family endonuclease [Rhodobacteraceae bacterium]|nr:Uma2 family endonuclease [Paracoccaceae bacterium]MCY4196387.1 Uma2 family endonuclease [Paracoccaceae bacterium]MCY4326460.1 Uma2 family endonuclease [Paracoccaceae bacterium]
MNRMTTAARAERPATYQDVLDAPPHMVAEVVAGTLHTQPRSAKRHLRAGSVLGMEIGSPFDCGRGGPGGWWIVDEPELHLGADIVVPDLAGWRRATLTEDMDGAFFTQAPDWVCEVLSPSTCQFDRGEKRAVYAREGITHLWFVDPEAKILEVFQLFKGQWVLLVTLADDAPVSQPPFEAISFPLDVLWSDGERTKENGEDETG